jgi:hypothetical protein
MKAPSIKATDIPEVPGNLMKRYNNPLTPTTASMNKSPFKGVSILKAAMMANK